MKLGVNVDHVATLRQARLPLRWQSVSEDVDPVRAALLCQKSGAHAIVMHLREDRRHIQDADLFATQKKLRVKLNMEMSLAPSVVKVALKLKPDQVTLVPEKRLERTTEGGLDLLRQPDRVRRCVDQMKVRGVVASLFVDPDLHQIEMAKKIGAGAVEFHTGDYANQANAAGIQKELKRLKKAVDLARALKLAPHAGHGLDYRNVRALRAVRGLEELNIGYAIIARALWVGLDEAVKQMLELIGD